MPPLIQTLLVIGFIAVVINMLCDWGERRQDARNDKRWFGD